MLPLGRNDEAEAPLREALQLGGEALYKGELEDAKLHAVPVDAAFTKLVMRLWSDLQTGP